MLKFFISYIIKGYFLFKKIEESIALFGGSFDPPHFGHREVVKYIAKRIVIPKDIRAITIPLDDAVWFDIFSSLYSIIEIAQKRLPPSSIDANIYRYG
jgi:hypothetical protein